MDAEFTTADYSPLHALAEGEPDVAAFLTKSLREQVSIQAEHRTAPTWSDAAEEALAKLELLPRAFNLSRPDQIALKRQREEAREVKNESVVDVHGAKLLEQVNAMLEAASDQDAFPSLIIPLLIASGRRSVEIISDRSSFAPTANEYEAMFSGAVKKRGKATPFTIKLLVPYRLFAMGIVALRQRQAKLGGVAHLTNAQIANRYQGTLKEGLNKMVSGCKLALPEGMGVHEMRDVYVALVQHCFTSTCTLARTTMQTLGHASLDMSLSYNRVRFLIDSEGLRGALGPLATPVVQE